MDREYKSDVARNLKLFRKRMGLSQEEVRNITGIDVAYYETSKRMPSLETLDRLSKLYEVHVVYFLLPEDEKRKTRILMDFMVYKSLSVVETKVKIK